jgi:hypothetical protein
MKLRFLIGGRAILRDVLFILFFFFNVTRMWMCKNRALYKALYNNDTERSSIFVNLASGCPYNTTIDNFLLVKRARKSNNKEWDWVRAAIKIISDAKSFVLFIFR